MSGIYGIINLKNNPVDPSQMNKMEELLIHRGVDGKAQWIKGHVGLGHLKLEITPESEYERLPLEYKQWVITADARIDNRDELDAPLSIEPTERPQTPDTTYIVKAYEKWGKDCVKHLIGDFAFAIWDKVEKTLFCARDHIGIKPFFYLKTKDKFIFASELKTIVELREIPVELNESKFGDWMYRIQDLHNPTDTLFMNITRMMPAHIGIVQASQLDIELYWKLERNKEINVSTDEAYIDKLRELMIQAVECRMRTNYQIGVTLSGGLDSSSVACIAARKLAKEDKFLYTASSVLPDNWDGIEEDEREYIEAVVEQEKNIVPSYITAEDKGAFDDLDSLFNGLYCPVNAFYYMDIALDESLKQIPNFRVKLNGFYGDIALSYKGNLILKNLWQENSFLLILFYFWNRIKLEKSISKSLKEIAAFILPYSIRRLYRKLKNKNLIGNDAFNLMTSNSFKKKYSLIERSKKQEEIRENLTTIISQVILNKESSLNILEEMNIRNSKIAMEELNPWSDIRLLNFIVNMPLYLFNYKGWQRGAIRFAMENVIPQKVGTRNHKTMYSPDFFYRVKKSKIETSSSNMFINVSEIKKNITATSSVKNWQSKNFDNAPIIFAYGYINYKFLEFLKKILY